MVSGGDADDSDRTIMMRAVIARTPPLNIGHYLVFSRDAELRRVPIAPGGMVIGRQPPADLVIPVADISRKHCRIDVHGDRATITDLGSTNGTFVGGERVEQETRLRNGSRLSLGSFAMRYERRDKSEVAEEAELAERATARGRLCARDPAAADQRRAGADRMVVRSVARNSAATRSATQFLDDGTFAGFVLDVSGHGIGSAMHAANVANVLRRHALPGVDFRDPAQVAAGLNAMFPMEEHNGLLFTLWYFVYEPPTRHIRFCAAGHHPSFLVSPGAAEPVPLWLRGPTIGMLPQRQLGGGPRRGAAGQPALRVQRRRVRDRRAERAAMGDRGSAADHEGHGPMPGVSEPQRLYEAVRAADRTGTAG